MAEAPLPSGSPYRAAPEPPPPPPWWTELRVRSGHLMGLAILIVPINFWVFTRARPHRGRRLGGPLELAGRGDAAARR